MTSDNYFALPPSGSRTRVPRLGLLRLRPDPVHGSPSREPLDGSSERMDEGLVVRLWHLAVKGSQRDVSGAGTPTSRLVTIL